MLNALFSSYGILVKEDFKRVDPDGAGIMEQIDGVVELSGHIYLVEMKWVKNPIGVDKLSQHLYVASFVMMRLFKRNAVTPLIPPKIKFKKYPAFCLPAGLPSRLRHSYQKTPSVSMKNREIRDIAFFPKCSFDIRQN